MGLDDEARSCLPAAFQTPQTGKHRRGAPSLSQELDLVGPSSGGRGELWRNKQGSFFGRQRRDLQVTINLLQPIHSHLFVFLCLAHTFP